jgi:transcription elongation GreA/GreB family factor
MDKLKILKAVQESLEDELRRQLAAQETAAAGATHTEAKAESKWDTCGLEQSYLARGHAKQFEALARQVEELRSFVPPCLSGKSIGAGALVETEMDGETFLFFLLNCGGGTELEVDGREITVITPESPVGAALVGKRQGVAYSFRAGITGKIRLVE